jgi:hypothetical protein
MSSTVSGADPTIPGDTADQWKPGRAELRTASDRVYLLFEWDSGARQGLIDARREGPQRLVGKYINLSNSAITRPWIGQIVSDRRIDGRWTEGRLDFRRLKVSRFIPRRVPGHGGETRPAGDEALVTRVNMPHLGHPIFARNTEPFPVPKNTSMLGTFRALYLAGTARRRRCCSPWIRPHDV